MTRVQPRASHGNDSLVRFLTENALLTPTRSGEGVGQRLGDWLDFRQAIALHGVLNPEHPERTPTPPVRRSALIAPDALARHLDKVRAQLAQSITQGAPAGSGLARIDMPTLSGDEAPEPKTAFAPYRRFVAAHQRQMESTLRSLRALLRQQLSQRGGPGQPLAALDAAFESILAEREATLLTQTTKLLEKRFVQTLKSQLQAQTQLQMKAQAEAPSQPEPMGSPAPNTHKPPATGARTKNDPSSGLMSLHQNLHQTLHQTLRHAMLAELDTRLQPALGLLEALTALTALTPQKP